MSDVTPSSKRDHFRKKWPEGTTWQRVEVPAHKVLRISAAFSKEERSRIGDRWYSQEYECQSRKSTNSVFSHATFMGALCDEVKPLFGEG